MLVEKREKLLERLEDVGKEKRKVPAEEVANPVVVDVDEEVGKEE